MTINILFCPFMEHYSTSDDLATISCFFAFQEIKDGPKKKQEPVVNLLVSIQPSQYAF
jgi:hypothetical protein